MVKKVKKAVSKKTGLSVDSLSLIFDGHELRDGQSIADCNIDHEDTITVETFTIRISHWDGDIFAFKDINPKDTIVSVKEKIFKLCQISPDDQKYLHDERPVNEFLSLRDQQIHHKAVLDLQEPKAKPKKEKFKLSLFPSAEPVGMKSTKANLTVKHWDGTTRYTMEFDPKGYVDDVKETLNKEHGISLAHLRLSFDGTEVDETEPMEDQGIEEGAVLVMEPMKVSIVAPGQKKPFKISVLPTDKIKRIKRIVAKKCGIEIDVQLVIFEGSNLRDGQSVEKCKLEHGSFLEIEKFCLTVEHWTGEEYLVNVIKPNDLIDDVKTVVEEKSGLPKAQQKYQFNGKPINDFMALSDQQIKHKCRLQLLEPQKKVEKREKFKLQVFGTADSSAMAAHVVGSKESGAITISVKHWDGEIFDIIFDPMDYIVALKDKIQEAKDIAVDQQRLSYNGSMLDDADTLMDVGIEDGGELKLEPMKISILLPNGKKSFKISVKPDDKIKKIKRAVAKKSKIEADRLCLMFNGVELEETKTVLGCDIDHDDKIKVETFELSIAHWSGDMFVLDDIHPEDCIDDVKQIILKRKKIPVKEQKFKFNGKNIQKLLSFKAQKISHKSVLIMEDPQPALFSPKSPRPTISHIKDVDTDDEYDNDDLSDASSVASWLKEAAHDENYTAELGKVDPSSESWLGMQAAKENRSSNKGKLEIPEL